MEIQFFFKFNLKACAELLNKWIDRIFGSKSFAYREKNVKFISQIPSNILQTIS